MRTEKCLFSVMEVYRLFSLAVGKDVPALKAYIYESAADHR